MSICIETSCLADVHKTARLSSRFLQESSTGPPSVKRKEYVVYCTRNLKQMILYCSEYEQTKMHYLITIFVIFKTHMYILKLWNCYSYTSYIPTKLFHCLEHIRNVFHYGILKKLLTMYVQSRNISKPNSLSLSRSVSRTITDDYSSSPSR